MVIYKARHPKNGVFITFQTIDPFFSKCFPAVLRTRLTALHGALRRASAYASVNSLFDDQVIGATSAGAGASASWIEQVIRAGNVSNRIICAAHMPDGVV